MAGLFDTFTVAKRGLTVQQSHINTSSHNIANVTTEGYSRQRAVAETTRPYGGQSRFDSIRVGQVGTGAEITNIQRIRDTFLDYQYREANSAAESLAEQSEFFSRIESILGEPSSTSIQNQFSDLYSKLQELQKNPEIGSAARISTIRAAQTLAQSLNQAYTKIDAEMEDVQKEMLTDVITINNYLNEIKELNKKIVEVSASGQTPNDYMDKRDLLLDKLSSQFGIKVTQDQYNAINVKSSDFQSPDNPIPNLINADPLDTNYVRFSYVKGVTVNADNTVTLQYQPNGGADVETIKITTNNADDANAIAESLITNRILIGDHEGLLANANGNEIDLDGIQKSIFKINDESKNAAGQVLNSVPTSDTDKLVGTNSRGSIAGKQQAQFIGRHYQKQLDVIAATLAYSMNAIQTGTMANNGAAPDGNTYDLIFINKEASTANAKTDTGITAKNISINQDILDDTSKLNTSATSISGDRNGDRAQAMADLLSTKFDLTNVENRNIGSLTREEFLTLTGNTFTDGTNVKLTSNSNGVTTANEYKSMVTKLGTNSKTISNRVTLADSSVDFFVDSREAESGVSIDEEMTDLIQFQHAYSANAKIISTIDELLDVVVNGLKR